MFKAKLYAVLAAIGVTLLGVIKMLTLQRNAAREDAKRARKHLEESRKITRAKKAILRDMHEAEQQAVKDIKNGKIPKNIRDRNSF